MSQALSALDLLPLVLKLSPVERLELVTLALRSTAVADDAAGTRAFPRPAHELSADGHPFAWEAEDWSEFYAPR